MSEPKTCWEKVEDGIADRLTAFADLVGWSVVVGESTDVAFDMDEGNYIIIWTTRNSMDQSDEQGQTIHAQTVDIELLSAGGAAGTLNRQNKQAAAYCHAALAADRTLGGMLQDLQEVDLAPAGAEGKDVNAASLQYQVTFFTRRDDWFKIIGLGGVEF